MGIVETVLRALGLAGGERESATAAAEETDPAAAVEEQPAEADSEPNGDDAPTGDRRWVDRSGDPLSGLRPDLTADDRSVRWGATAAAVDRLRSGDSADPAFVSQLLDDVEAGTSEAPAVVLGTVAELSPGVIEPHAERLVDAMLDREGHVREHLAASLTQLSPDAIPVEPLVDALRDEVPGAGLSDVSSVLGHVAVGAPERLPVDRLRDGGAGPRLTAEATAYLRLLLHATGADPGTRPSADFGIVASADFGGTDGSEGATPEDDGYGADDETDGGRLRGVDEFVARRLDEDRVRRFLDEQTDVNCVDFDVAQTPMGAQMVVYTDPVPDRPAEFAERVGERFGAQVDVQEP